MKTIIEPFKIKSVEPIRFATVQQREESLRRGHYNLFLVPADEVLIDLLTDSGTAAMSADQWAGIMPRPGSLRRRPQLLPLRGQSPRADRLETHHPHPPGTRRRTHPLLHRRRTRQAGAEQFPFRHHAGERRVRRRRGRRSARGQGHRSRPHRRLQRQPRHGRPGRVHRPRRRREHPAVHDHGDEQLRRRPAGLHGKHPPHQGHLPAARHPLVPGRLPLRRKRLFHQAPRAGLRRPLRQEHRPGDVLLRRWGDDAAPRKTPSSTWADSWPSTTTPWPPRPATS